MKPFDEMLQSGDMVRAPYARLKQWLDTQNPASLAQKAYDAEGVFRKTGITFAVYGDAEAAERLIPFDIVPRIISGAEWSRLSLGIEQRVMALNAFLDDIYHRQEIVRAGIVPKHLIAHNEAFIPEMIDFRPPGNVYTHIIGVDIVRTGENEFYVLEDNARTPSGVSYMLENRETMMQLFPELFQQVKVRPVETYPQMLRQSLAAVCPPGGNADNPTVAVLTPGIHNSAYYEHSFLADQMGVHLVEGSDLQVIDGRVAMRTTEGFQPIDVLYRRVDDAFLDPLTFRPDSVLGVAGIMDVYRAGNITIANAPGTGIADDKAIYSYMPEIVEFYTGRKALLENVPPALRRSRQPEIRARPSRRTGREGSARLGRLRDAGRAVRIEGRLEAFAAKLRARPYIAQPTLALSTTPILTEAGLAPRHVDLRPFVLVSDRIRITPGGLTRVALKEGSLVVNSSRGGTQGHLGAGRLSRTRPRARDRGANRTKTEWTRDASGTYCKRSLLDVPLYRARGEHRAHRRCRAADGAHAHVRRAGRMVVGARQLGHGRRLPAEIRRVCGRYRDRLPAARPRQPVERAVVYRGGALERADGAHGAHARGMGERERRVARAAPRARSRCRRANCRPCSTR